jgi:DNA-binding beta-propeller fold protein YncE
LGDGGPARLASLYGPSGVAVGKAGVVLIADTYHNRIRSIDNHGTITTVAGDGIDGFRGDGHKATSAELSKPLGVATDRYGNIYIADEGNNRVREVMASSGAVKTVAGGGTCRQSYCGEGRRATRAKIESPQAVAVDGAGDLYIAASDRLLEVLAKTGIIRTVAGSGKLPATLSDQRRQLGDVSTRAAELDPIGIAVDKAGYVLMVDAAGRTIREIRFH